MANTVETFRGISSLIFKWLLLAVLGIVGIAVAVDSIAYVYNYVTYERHAARVVINVAANKGAICSGTPEYPLFVTIINNSSMTVEMVTFSLEARRKDYSTNLATYASYSDDKIIKPSEGYGQCWRAPLKPEVKDDPRDLEWKVSNVRIFFQ